MSEQLRLLNSITQIGPHYDMLNIPHNLTINYEIIWQNINKKR